MTAKINSDTSDGLKITSDTSGILDIQSAGTTKMTVGTTIDIQGNELVLDADADTSITADTDDRIDFKTAGTDRVHFTSQGNVGVGTNAPTHLADAYKTIEVKGTDTNGSGVILATSTAGIQTQMISSDASGVGTIGTRTNHPCTFSINNAEKMRIGTTGEILFNKTTNNFGTAGVTFNDTGSKVGAVEMICSGNEPLALNRLSSDGGIIVFHKDGSSGGSITTTASSTSYNTSSDYRLKENVDYTFDATARLKQLKPARFNFIADADKTVDGFIAHEVSSIVPEAIIGTKDATRTATNVVKNADGTLNSEGVTEAEWTKDKEDGNYANDTTWSASMSGIPVMQQIDQAKLVPLLVKTIQELEARITALES